MKLQHFGHLMRTANSLEKTLIMRKIEGRRRRGQQRKRWLDGITDAVDVNLGKLWEMMRAREAWHAVVHGVAKNWTCMTGWLNNMKTKYEKLLVYLDSYISRKIWLSQKFLKYIISHILCVTQSSLLKGEVWYHYPILLFCYNYTPKDLQKRPQNSLYLFLIINFFLLYWISKQHPNIHLPSIMLNHHHHHAYRLSDVSHLAAH